MATNLIDLAHALKKISPQTLPKLSKLLEQKLSPAQSHVVKNMSTQSANIPFGPKQAGKRSGAGLRFISGPATPTPSPSSHQQHADHVVQATVTVLAHQQYKSILLSVAQEGRREAKMSFYMLYSFFALCLIILLAGIVLLFQKDTTSAGAILTTLGTILSTVGGMLVNYRQSTNKRLDELIEKIQNA